MLYSTIRCPGLKSIRQQLTEIIVNFRNSERKNKKLDSLPNLIRSPSPLTSSIETSKGGDDFKTFKISR